MRERILERVDSLFNTTDRLETSPNNPYSKLPDTFLAYVAGLIDGEGCIFIHSSPNAKGERRQYDMGVTISNTSQEFLSHLKLYLDGYTDKTTAHGKQVYCLRFNSEDAAMLLEAVYPYLVLKAERARLASEFQRKIRKRKARQGRRLSEDDIYERKDFKRIFTILNRRGI